MWEVPSFLVYVLGEVQSSLRSRIFFFQPFPGSLPELFLNSWGRKEEERFTCPLAYLTFYAMGQGRKQS